MYELSGLPLKLEEIAAIGSGERVQIAPETAARMAASRELVQSVTQTRHPVYGINTGFGKLCDVRIPPDALNQLQLNLVRSHACGIGNPLSEAETRVVLALRANTLALGVSGVRPLVAETLCAMVNRGIHPVIPE